MTLRSAPAAPPRSGPTLAGALAVCALAAVAFGVVHALRLAWVTDDAFISFRYADHLVRGQGLVFNAGERVEGYSNFLWTLWCAVGIALGTSPVTWSIASGITCYAATLALLAGFAWRRNTARLAPGATGTAPVVAPAALPIAAWLGAVHRDWAIFATSGLETSAFTLIVVAGFVLVVEAAGRSRRLLAAGAVFALAALSRPDGLLFAAIAGGYVLAVSPQRGRDGLAYAAPLVIVMVPYLAWKLAYYGDLLPNTYYAKSANRAWYAQGLVYTGLYFRKYWAVLIGAAACALAASRRTRASAAAGAGDDDGGPRRWNHAAGLAAAMAIGYTLYVTHVGGDFMYARLLIPATPFWLLLAELGVERLVRTTRGQVIAAVVLVLATGFTPYPFAGQGWVHGIVNEWEFYTPGERDGSRSLGLRLRDYFDGLPIRMAFCGGQAVLAYYSRAPLAIETATGLTDSTIAHQPIARRGRVGHEKKTPIPYLIARGTHFWMYSGSLLSDSLAAYIPLVPMKLDTLTVMAITWDPPVMDALRARGAQVPDFLVTLDRFIAAMPAAPDADVRTVYAKTRNFYFDHVSDPEREAPFRARLGLPPP